MFRVVIFILLFGGLANGTLAASTTINKTNTKPSSELIDQFYNFINRFLTLSEQFEDLTPLEEQQIANLKASSQIESNITQENLQKTIQQASKIASDRRVFLLLH